MSLMHTRPHSRPKLSPFVSWVLLEAFLWAVHLLLLHLVEQWQSWTWVAGQIFQPGRVGSVGQGIWVRLGQGVNRCGSGRLSRSRHSGQVRSIWVKIFGSGQIRVGIHVVSGRVSETFRSGRIGSRHFDQVGSVDQKHLGRVKTLQPVSILNQVTNNATWRVNPTTRRAGSHVRTRPAETPAATNTELRWLPWTRSKWNNPRETGKTRWSNPQTIGTSKKNFHSNCSKSPRFRTPGPMRSKFKKN